MMKRYSSPIFIVLFLFFSSILSISFSMDDYREFTFEFYHSLRIPFNHVTISIQKSHSQASLHLESSPMASVKDARWNYSRKDTMFNISLTDFDALDKKIRMINAMEIRDSPGGFGNDGTSTSIEYGNGMTSVKYSAWSPDYNTDARKLTDYFDACKTFVTMSGLKLDDVFDK